MTASSSGVLRPSPLSAWLWLRRHPRQAAPLVAIQALVTALLVMIITPTNAFRATSEAYAEALARVTIASPLRQFAFDDDLLARLDANPGQAERVEAKMFWLKMPMIVGQGFAPLIAVPDDARDAFLERVGARLVEGHWPRPGTDDAVLHDSLITARGFRLGDAFGRLEDPADPTPGRFVVVGRLEGSARLGIVDHAYASRPASVLARTPPFQLVYAKAGREAESDAYLRDLVDDEGRSLLHVVDRAYLAERIDESLANLPVLLGFITAAVALVVALVTSLLAVVAFQARVDEFGLQLAVGHRVRTLVRKLARETALVATLGWAIGLGIGLTSVTLYRDLVLEPKGILMQVPDMRPILLSLLVPTLSTVVASFVIARRLRGMDPVSVIQRRGA
ncbi:MAG: ABC transporter permease [Planctomycetes bacterium]|nr:ABC transporter permease [Planctomycetota bacterium]MCB9824399.1 ABC transporter permease [Planctomycetota bacterium]MCB9900396.1 ABC transporter permease [Planctomycetota bacterium]